MILPGSTVTLSATFTKTSTGAVTDPTTITLTVVDPQDSETEYTYAEAEVLRSGTGAYYYDLAVPFDEDSEGEWWFRWNATGAVAGVVEGKFIVRQSRFT
jgi:hypothetical protein